MKGEHKPGYRRPRVGEKRQVRQPFAIDKLPSEWREQIIAWRAQWMTWEEIEEETKTLDWAALEKADPEFAISNFADKRIPASTLHNWYDVRWEQSKQEAADQFDRTNDLIAKYEKEGISELKDAGLNALGAQVFAAMENATPAERAALLKRLVEAQAKHERNSLKRREIELKEKELQLAEKKFEGVRAKGAKATDEAAAKLGQGKTLTLADINRIRERALGLPAIAAGGGASAGSPTA